MMGDETATTSAAATTTGAATAPTILAPGFQFHPTDEELLSYYLKHKVCKKPVRFDFVGEVDIYKNKPWDLAGYSRLKTRDQEWYFFSTVDKKYANDGARTNRSNAKGYWKATGRNDSQLIGMKKNLVFYSRCSLNGQRTNWVMHEYRVFEAEYEKHGTGQEAYVLCRIFHKNNRGPQNGNRYAPFIEEEWDDGEATVVPGVDTVDEVAPVDDAYIERHNVEQDTPSIHMDPLSVNNGPTRETQNLLPVNNGPPRETKDLFPVNNEPPKETQNLLPFNHEPSRETQNLLPVNNEPSRETQNLLPVCKRERVEDVTPICVLNTQAPFRLLPYKRRHIDSSSNHSIASENSASASTTMTAAVMATMASTSMASATVMPVSAMMEFSLMESLKLKESPYGRTLTLNTANLNPSVPPSPSDRTLTLNTANCNPSVPPSILKFINDLKEELHKVSVDRETLKLKMMSARATINILQSRLDFLINENEILKRRIRDT